MTPKKASAISRELNVKCDTAFMFAFRVGSGCHVSCKGTRDPHIYLTMLLTLIDGIFDRLSGNPEQIKEFKTAFTEVLKAYVEDSL